jgi:hypothetical protein
MLSEIDHHSKGEMVGGAPKQVKPACIGGRRVMTSKKVDIGHCSACAFFDHSEQCFSACVARVAGCTNTARPGTVAPTYEDMFMVRMMSLQLEELDARILPSATSLPVAPPAPPALSAVSGIAFHLLSGQGEGTFFNDAIQSGAGIDYHLSGEGQFAGVGQVSIHGSVHSVGFLAQGHAGGTITLTNVQGSVTLTLIGPAQPGFSPLPVQFSYHASSGTGAYTHLPSQGTLSLVLATQPNGLGIHATSGPHGAFALAVELQGQPGATLDGALAGNLTHGPIGVDAGISFKLNGSGTLAGAGPVSVTGFVQGTGLVVSGHATGALTLTDAQGSITLDLVGPTQGWFAPLPEQFQFTVRSGTGAYAHLQGAGTVTLHLDTQDNTFALAILFADNPLPL